MTYKIKKGSETYTHEWMMKEYGSWEDHDCDQSHVCAILQRELATKLNYMVLNEIEAKGLLVSAEYHCSAGWDGFDSHLEKQWFEKCVKGYADRIKNALNNQVIVHHDNQVKKHLE